MTLKPAGMAEPFSKPSVHGKVVIWARNANGSSIAIAIVNNTFFILLLFLLI